MDSHLCRLHLPSCTVHMLDAVGKARALPGVLAYHLRRKRGLEMLLNILPH